MIELNPDSFPVLKTYVEGNSEPWTVATVRIYFNWTSHSFSPRDVFMNDVGQEAALKVPKAHRRGLMGELSSALKLIKQQTIDQAESQWNILEYRLSADGDQELKVSWDQKEEDERHPVIEHDRESEIEAEIHDNQARNLLDIEGEFDSNGLIAWHRIRTLERGVQHVVRQMVQQGSDIGLDGFEAIDFGEGPWQEFEGMVKEMWEKDQNFKMKLSGGWNKESGRYMHVDLIYSYHGEKAKYRITI